MKNKAKAVLMRTLSASLLIILLISAAVFTTAAEEGQVEVTIRCKWALEYEPFYHSLNVLVAECTDSTGETLIRADGKTSPHDRKITLRSTEWEQTVSLVPGYYKLSYESPDYNDAASLVWGRSDVFEVKSGQKMTVYIYLQGSAEQPDPPANEWVIYGEDTRDYWIWGTNYVRGMRIGTPEEIESQKAEHPELIFLENGTVSPEDEKYLTEPDETNAAEPENTTDADSGYTSDTLPPPDTNAPEVTTEKSGGSGDSRDNGEKSRKTGTIIAWSIAGILAVTGVVFLVREKIRKSR